MNVLRIIISLSWLYLANRSMADNLVAAVIDVSEDYSIGLKWDPIQEASEYKIYYVEEMLMDVPATLYKDTFNNNSPKNEAGKIEVTLTFPVKMAGKRYKIYVVASQGEKWVGNIWGDKAFAVTAVSSKLVYQGQNG